MSDSSRVLIAWAMLAAWAIGTDIVMLYHRATGKLGERLREAQVAALRKAGPARIIIPAILFDVLIPPVALLFCLYSYVLGQRALQEQEKREAQHPGT